MTIITVIIITDDYNNYNDYSASGDDQWSLTIFTVIILTNDYNNYTDYSGSDDVAKRHRRRCTASPQQELGAAG